MTADESSAGLEPAALPVAAEKAIEAAPETALEHARRLLEPFLTLNPSAAVEQVTAPKECVAVIMPWGDASLIFQIPENTAAYADALNHLYLPRRFTAIWHEDSKDFEVIWTAFSFCHKAFPFSRGLPAKFAMPYRTARTRKRRR